MVKCAAKICSLFRVKRLGLLHGTGRRYSCLVINISASRLIKCGGGHTIVPFRREGRVITTVGCISRIIARSGVGGVRT